MSTKELKEEIYKAIENAPDSVLKDIYEYLQQLEGIDSKKLNLVHNLNRILKEDNELLKKLAL